ncbi:MAG: hypothetical protein KIS94_04570 [Chitinophagales bacterium]|nr:hypothetical protein [Chitinophagales bacterium]
MKTAVSFAFLIVLFSVEILKAATTGRVTGKIVDTETNLLVPDIEIVFENSMDRVILTTGTNGIYYGNHLPTGKYTVTVAYNNRTFVMKNVRIYDGYASEVNFKVSSNNFLSEVVTVAKEEKIISSISPTDVMMGDNRDLQPTRSLTEVLGNQAGMDVRDGKLYVKGSSEVRFFIDGTPLMGNPTFQRNW